MDATVPVRLECYLRAPRDNDSIILITHGLPSRLNHERPAASRWSSCRAGATVPQRLADAHRARHSGSTCSAPGYPCSHVKQRASSNRIFTHGQRFFISILQLYPPTSSTAVQAMPTLALHVLSFSPLWRFSLLTCASCVAHPLHILRGRGGDGVSLLTTTVLLGQLSTSRLHSALLSHGVQP